MALPLRDSLRRLCVEIGWSYAVFWKPIGSQHPKHLVWDDGYCEAVRDVHNDRTIELGSRAEDGVQVLVNKRMVFQVHVIGEGIVGQAALTGTYQWVVCEAFNGYGSASRGVGEMNQQFLAGIQTIVIIPVLPRGVLQVGSTQLVMEDTAFVIHAKRIISLVNNHSGVFPSETAQESLSKKGQSCSASVMSRTDAVGPCLNVDMLLPSTSDQSAASTLLVAAVSSSATHLSCTSSSKLREKTASVALTSESLTNKQCVKPTSTPHMTSFSVYNPPSICKIMQLECEYPHSNARPGLRDLRHITGSENQIQPAMGSSDVNCSLKSLEELLFVENVASIEYQNVDESRIDVSRTIQWKTDGCYSTSRLEDSDVVPCQTEEQEYSTLGSMLKNQSFCPQKIAPAMPSAKKAWTEENDLLQASGDPGSGAHCNSLLVNTDPPSHVHRTNSSLPYTNAQHFSITGNVANDCCSSLNEKGCKLSNMPENLLLHLGPTCGNDLYDMLGPTFHQLCGDADTVSAPRGEANAQGSNIPALDSNTMNIEFSHSDFFSVGDSDQLLDAILSNINSVARHSSDDNLSCKTSLTDLHSSCGAHSSNHRRVSSTKLKQDESFGIPPAFVKNEMTGSCYVKPSCFSGTAQECPRSQNMAAQNMAAQKSQICFWIESGQNMRCDSISYSGKMNRKRSRPGENPRPQPKDRQLIQERIKELRELVPNGAKCSIDVLLEKTIKHMLFLRSVTKHADKLKESRESKIVNKEGGLLLKDCFEGSATWAFEVGSRSMVCPIIVEDFNPPRQMLVEMLCNDQGIFLEIADFIRGLGLTILKGVMKAQKNKIWARFSVEANRDVTRIEIFLSLMRLLEPNAGSSVLQNANNINIPQSVMRQTGIQATGSSDCLR